MKEMSKLIAMVIRNAMENFHCKHLSDAQMKELNPIIRNAVYTALYSIKTYRKNKKSKLFVDFHARSIPDYWEEPVLINGYTDINVRKILKI